MKQQSVKKRSSEKINERDADAALQDDEREMQSSSISPHFPPLLLSCVIYQRLLYCEERDFDKEEISSKKNMQIFQMKSVRSTTRKGKQVCFRGCSSLSDGTSLLVVLLRFLTGIIFLVVQHRASSLPVFSLLLFLFLFCIFLA